MQSAAVNGGLRGRLFKVPAYCLDLTSAELYGDSCIIHINGVSCTVHRGKTTPIGLQLHVFHPSSEHCTSYSMRYTTAVIWLSFYAAQSEFQCRHTWHAKKIIHLIAWIHVHFQSCIIDVNKHWAKLQHPCSEANVFLGITAWPYSACPPFVASCLITL